MRTKEHHKGSKVIKSLRSAQVGRRGQIAAVEDRPVGADATNIPHSSFKRFVGEIWPFIIRIVSIVTGKRFRKDLCSNSRENTIDRVITSIAFQKTDSDAGSHREENISEIFNSPLVRSIREKHANIEKNSDFVCEDMENQDSEVVF